MAKKGDCISEHQLVQQHQNILTKEFIRENAKRKAMNAFTKLKTLSALTNDLWNHQDTEPVKARSTGKLDESNIEEVLTFKQKPNIVCYRR